MTIDDLVDRITTIEASELAPALRANPALVHERTRLGDTLLHEACWHKRLELVQVLLAAGADVNARGDHGRTPLHCAANDAPAERMAPLIEALIAAGAVPEVEDGIGFTPEEIVLREAWGSPAPALAALGVETPSYVPDQTHWMTSHAIAQLLDASRDGRSLDAQVDGADPRCLDDLRQVLALVATTSWAAPLRVWLRTRAKPAYANRLAAIYRR